MHLTHSCFTNILLFHRIRRILSLFFILSPYINLFLKIIKQNFRRLRRLITLFILFHFLPLFQLFLLSINILVFEFFQFSLLIWQKRIYCSLFGLFSHKALLFDFVERSRVNIKVSIEYEKELLTRFNVSFSRKLEYLEESFEFWLHFTFLEIDVWKKSFVIEILKSLIKEDHLFAETNPAHQVQNYEANTENFANLFVTSHNLARLSYNLVNPIIFKFFNKMVTCVGRKNSYNKSRRVSPKERVCIVCFEKWNQHTKHVYQIVEIGSQLFFSVPLVFWRVNKFSNFSRSLFKIILQNVTNFLYRLSFFVICHSFTRRVPFVRILYLFPIVNSLAHVRRFYLCPKTHIYSRNPL